MKQAVTPLPTATLPRKPALQINEPGDAFEQEADRVADAVVRGESVGVPFALSGTAVLQRCACGKANAGGECEDCKKKRLQRSVSDEAASAKFAPPIMHEVLHSSGQPLDGATRTFTESRFGHDPLEQEAHRVADQVMAAPAIHAVSGGPPRMQRFAGQPNGPMDVAPASVDRVLASAGRPLEPTLREDMEQRFGYDFSQVRVHFGAAAEESARDVNAHAYTVGRDIVFGAGRFVPGVREGRRLLAHELTHVLQQTGMQNGTVHHAYPGTGADRVVAQAVRSRGQINALGSAPPILARAPIEPVKSAEEVKKTHQVDLQHLKELLTSLLHSLSPAVQARIDRNSTIVVALVEMADENNNPFTTLVYATNRNANTPELEAVARQLGIEHVGDAVPRAESRGETGAPSDAEQLLDEAVSENDMKVLGQAIQRPPCKDCSVMIKDQEVMTIWLDRAARKSAFAAGRLYRKGSADLQKALTELNLAFSSALTAPGTEAQSGLGADAPIWANLNVLDIKELYKVFELVQQQGRLNVLEERAQKAHGIYNDRLLAVTAALQYKKQLQSSSPTDSALMGSHWGFHVASANLPPDQVEFLQRTLQPALRSIVKQKASPKPKPEMKSAKPEPNKETAPLEKSANTGFGEAAKKGLKAAGIAISGLALLELAEAVATALFIEVVLATAAQALKGAATDRAKEVVMNEVRKRVALTPEQLVRVGESVLHEIEPILDTATKALGL